MADLVGTREQLLFGKWSYDEVEVSYNCSVSYTHLTLPTIYSV